MTDTLICLRGGWAAKLLLPLLTAIAAAKRGGASVLGFACAIRTADAALSRAPLLAACAQDKPLHSAAYKVVCSGQAFAQCRSTHQNRKSNRNCLPRVYRGS